MEKGKEIPNFIERMNEEIPAFLFFLNKRQLFTQKKTRQWFDYVITETEALKRLKEKQKPYEERKIREWVRNYFLDFNDESFEMDFKAMMVHIGFQDKQETRVNNILKGNIKVERYKNSDGREVTRRFKIKKYSDISIQEDGMDIQQLPYIGRPFVFYAKDFLTADEMKLIQTGNHVLG